ncbi:hypothetical protein BB558_000485 [Smittium angustum]|uniref:NADH dehydrogenase [ubiquinone] 1 alpha subcomplex assembly factor 3 n=1 Tax=Smittium angustum TaxID=133377 RepID=A0A2U1JE39_SMIAN|nr:hypothetical protein BB558_004282 [Smittium angustum]PWA03357.1 hypothetical protein BB558_000485 [Smittium angustum]
MKLFSFGIRTGSLFQRSIFRKCPQLNILATRFKYREISNQPEGKSFGETNVNNQASINTKDSRISLGKIKNMFSVSPDAVGISKDLIDGFRLSDERVLKTDILIINNSTFEWCLDHPTDKKTNAIANIKPEAFKIFEVVSPKPEILVLGTGKLPRKLPEDTRNYLLKLGIKLDQSTTKNACGTFNFLMEEGRKVAFAAVRNCI